MDNLIKQDRVTFQEEQDQLLETILNARFFRGWKRGRNVNYSDTPLGSMEIYLTSTCNQKCEYCYLVKHPELYPAEYNKKEIVLKNLRHLLDWALDNQFHFPQIELYSGEIWHTDYGVEVLDICLSYVKRGLEVEEFLIPTNGSFLRDEHQILKMEYFIREFRKHFSSLRFSLSIDGAVIENMNRPLNSGEQKQDEFYERAFMFAKKHGHGFHPMLSAKSAKYWIENWQWWKKKLHEYDLPMNYCMILEVRNDDWEDEDIEHLKAFIRHTIKEAVNFHDGDMGCLAEDIFAINQTYFTEHYGMIYESNMPYVPLLIGENKGYHGCTVATALTVRLGDMAICPCHRTSYNKNLYGWFRQNEEGEIVGIKANNPQQAVNIFMMDQKAANAGCDTCIYAPVCLGGCLGVQMETNKDPFMLVPGVCKMLKEKYKCCFETYEEIGLFDWMRKNITPYHVWYPQLERLMDVWDKIKEEKRRERLAELRQDFYR